MTKRYDPEDWGGLHMKECKDGGFVCFGQYDRLHQAALSLRWAQRLYMENRGNDDLGKKVGIAALELDKILSEE